MRYRTCSKLSWEVSALGFGAMRLPVIDNDAGQIDEPKAIEMIRHAVDQGVNYVDTAYPYHKGASEVLVGKALQGGYREKVKLVTKMPCWLVKEPADFDTFLNEQLARLQTDHLDAYLLHALWDERWEQMKKLDVFSWAARAMADGRIGTLGFSFHGTASLFKEIIDSYDWKLCQIQWNFLNERLQAGTEGLEYAGKKGVAVVVMEPLLGGAIARPPPPVEPVWREANRQPVDVALRWIWDRPEVSVILSGMGTLDQVRENLAIADRSAPGGLSPEEHALVRRVQEAYDELDSVPCTQCGYCVPCPNGVDIPGNTALFNSAVYGNRDLARAIYTHHFSQTARAGACTACRACEEECPQQLEISAWMKRIDAELFVKEETA